MKQILLSAFCLFFTLSYAQKLKTLDDSASYAIGVSIGKNFQSQGLTTIDPDLLAAAIEAVLNNKELIIEENKTSEIIKEYSTLKREEQYKENITLSENFLKKNAKKENIKELPSGLQYEILQEGNGPIPKSTDKVTVHYHGTLIDGTVFDSSVQRGTPATFPVTGVIKGWVEALQLMPVGSKWKLYIPADLAYGANPRPGGVIEPYMALIFEVELISIN